MRPLFALFLRSLREDTRSRATYITRAVLVMLVLFFLYVVHVESQWVGAAGRQFFGSVLGIDLFILCVVGLTYFASAITEEKEDETLGLLRMTELNTLAILFGKSSSRLFGALLLIAAQLPFALVAVTMGGLSVRQILAGFVLLLSFAFLNANLGLLASVLCRRTSGASILSACALAVFELAPLALQDKAGPLFPAWQGSTTLRWRSELLWTGFSEPLLGQPFLVHIALGILAFLAAWLLFEGSTNAAPEPTAASPTLVPGDVLARGRVPMRAVRWKDFQYISGGPAAIAIKGVITFVAILVIISQFSSHDFGMFSVGSAIAVPSGLILALCLAIDASRIFKIERTGQTLSSLVGLPIPVTTMIWEKVRGCLLSSVVPVLCLLLGLAILGCAALGELAKERNAAEVLYYGVFIVLYGIIAFLLLPVLIAWLSLRMRWGAFPVGFTVWFIGNWIIGVIVVLTMQQASAAMLPVIHGFILGALAVSIPSRVAALAAQE